MQCAGYVSFFGAQAHQPAACFLVRRIEIDDRFGQPFLAARIHTFVDETGFESAHQPLVQRLALGEQPAAKFRIDVLESGEQALGGALRVEKQRVRAVLFGLVDHGPEIDLHLFRVDLDRKLFGLQPVIADLQQRLPKFAQGLAQRGARLVLLGFAPEQPDETLAGLLPVLVEGQERKHRP